MSELDFFCYSLFIQEERGYDRNWSFVILVVSKCDVLTTYLSCLDCILIKIDARQLHDFLSSWKSLKFSV